MKIKEGFMLREIAGSWIVVDLVKLITSEYKVDLYTAAANVDEFISAVGAKGLIVK